MGLRPVRIRKVVINKIDKTDQEWFLLKLCITSGEHKQCALGLLLKETMARPFVDRGGGGDGGMVVVEFYPGRKENFIIDIFGTLW